MPDPFAIVIVLVIAIAFAAIQGLLIRDLRRRLAEVEEDNSDLEAELAVARDQMPGGAR